MTIRTILNKGRNMATIERRKTGWAKLATSCAFAMSMGLLVLALVLSQGSALACPPIPGPPPNPPPPPCTPACQTCPTGPLCDGVPPACNPVVYASGIAMQSATDVLLPGKGLLFKHSRQFNNRESALRPYVMGAKASAPTLESFVHEDDLGNVTVYVEGMAKFFSKNVDGTYSPRLGFDGQLVKSATTFAVKFKKPGIVYAFNNQAGAPKGILLSKADRYGARESYAYSSSEPGGGRIATVTAANNSQITYSYVQSGPNAGKIASVWVRDTANTLIQKVNYTYCISNSGYCHSDTGTTGDLLMVEKFERATADAGDTLSIRKITMYRYYNSSSADGRANQLKMEFDPEAVQTIMEDNREKETPDFATESDILTKADTFAVDVDGTRELSQYASKVLKYYIQNYNTGSEQDSTWPVGSPTSLNNRYSTSDFNETGYVKSELIRNGCGSCGGGSTNGITNQLYYLDLNGGPADDPTGARNPNVVYRVTVKDTLDGNNIFVKREVFGLNNDGVELRKVTAIAQGGNPLYWCGSKILGTSGGAKDKIVEERSISAHTRVNEAAEVVAFLNPSSGSNDADTLNAAGAGPGFVDIYEYDTYGNKTCQKIRDIKGDGSTSQTWVVRAYDYGDGTNDRRDLVRHEYSYPQLVTSTTDASRVTTTFDYTYHGGDLDKVMTRTTTCQAVPYAHHGSDTETVVREYFDAAGQLRWKKDAAGYVTYYSYHPTAGGLAYQMVDVDTASLDSAITAGSEGKWEAWSGGVPAGFTRTGASVTKLQLVTKYEYDVLGRQVMAEDPDGVRTYTAYANRQTAVYPGCVKVSSNPDTYSAKLPVQVTVTDDAGKMLRQYGLAMSATTFEFSGTLPSVSGMAPGTFTSYSRNNYDDRGMLSSTDQFYDIPASGDPSDPSFGTQGTHFFRTGYEYDEQGRRFKTISPEETISITQYDLLGRRAGTWMGTDATGATSLFPSGTVSGTGNNMVCLSLSLYDSATTGAIVVGDGHVTSSLRFTGTGANDYYKTENVYDWRGRLERTRGPDLVAAKYTYDNMGRATAVRTYVGDVEAGGSTWRNYDDSALDTNGKLRAKSASSYDANGLVYSTTLYEVGTTGAIGSGTMVTGYWYDADGKVIKVKGPDGVFDKTLYDGAGRVLAANRSYDSSEADTDYSSAGLLTTGTVLNVTFNQYSGTRQVATWRGTAISASPTRDTPRPTVMDGNMGVVEKVWYDTNHDGTGQNRPYPTGVSNPMQAASEEGGFVLTTYEHDAAGRVVAGILPDPDGAGAPLTETKVQTDYDDLGRKTASKVFKKDGQTLTLLAQSAQTYDNDHLAASLVYAVTNGSAGSAAITSYTYDDYGRVSKVTQPSGAYTRTAYNLAGDTLATYLCTDSSGEKVFEKVVYGYDSAGRVWLTKSFQRRPDDTASGDLTAGNSRMSQTVAWFDDLGRTRKTAQYGTNGGTEITQKAQVSYDSGGPSVNSSSEYMVAVSEYDGFGRQSSFTDNRGIVTRKVYDAGGRVTHTIENFLAGSTYWTQTSGHDDYDLPLSRSSDVNRITKMEYTQDGRLSKLIALDPKCDGNVSGQSDGDNQVTQYLYVVSESVLPRTDVVTRVYYPDKNGTTDYVRTNYNYDGSVAARRDQRGVLHAYTYDYRGRVIMDTVWVLAAGVDDSIQAIGYAYDDGGRPSTITSYDAAEEGNIVNQVLFKHDAWSNVSRCYEAHSGAVSESSPVTPNTQYVYDENAGNASGVSVRLGSTIYPSGQTVYNKYPTSGIDVALNRLSGIGPETGSNYVEYGYLGAASIVTATHPAVSGGLKLSYYNSANGSFPGFDNLGRVIEQKWTNNDGSTIIDHFNYAYDKGGNRLYRENAATTLKSELYSYDALARLLASSRGNLNGNKDAIQNKVRGEAWNLTQTGNWDQYRIDADGDDDYGDAGDLDQTRTHNTVNEILTISGQSNPVYDAAGNMTDDGQSFKYEYDAWNRLTKVRNRSDDSLVATYKYDGKNYRIAKTVGETTTDFYYNTDWQVLEERKGGVSNPYAQYVWDKRYIDAPVVRWRDSNTDGTIDDTLYYLNDANMNVTAVVNASGSVVERYVYDAYGKVTFLDGSFANPSSSSSVGNEILYCGYRYNPETGNYQVRNRELRPNLGWLQRDPINYQDGLSLYQYCRSMPPVSLDFSGYGTALAPNGAAALAWAYYQAGMSLEEIGRRFGPIVLAVIIAYIESNIAPDTIAPPFPINPQPINPPTPAPAPVPIPADPSPMSPSRVPGNQGAPLPKPNLPANPPSLKPKNPAPKGPLQPDPKHPNLDPTKGPHTPPEGPEMIPPDTDKGKVIFLLILRLIESLASGGGMGGVVPPIQCPIPPSLYPPEGPAVSNATGPDGSRWELWNDGNGGRYWKVTAPNGQTHRIPSGK